MGKTLYVSDLDGTLLSPDSNVSATTRDMLNEAIARGALFTVATARTPATVSKLLAGINLPLPAIVMTGSALWNVDTGKYQDVKLMKPHEARRIHDICRRHSLPGFIYTIHNHKIHIYHMGSLSGLDRQFMEERKDSPFKEFHIPETGESEIPEEAFERVLLFYTMHGNDEVEAVYRELLKEDSCNPVTYHDIYGEDVRILEVFSSRSSKAAAVRHLAECVGADSVTVFGDNINDLSMFGVADTAVAVENGIAEVRESADVVIGPNSADSVAGYILNDIEVV